MSLIYLLSTFVGFYLFLFGSLTPSVRSFILSIPVVLVFVSVPSSEIHPSFWAPCSLHPLHRNDCNSGCGLVLVVGAGVPEGKVWAELISMSVCLSVSSPKQHKSIEQDATSLVGWKSIWMDNGALHPKSKCHFKEHFWCFSLKFTSHCFILFYLISFFYISMQKCHIFAPIFQECVFCAIWVK